MREYVAATAVSVVLGFGCLGSAGAATLELNLTGDNQFAVYVSSSDGVLGTLVGSGYHWETTYSFSYPLEGPGPQYIHVIAVNWTSDNGLWRSPGTLNGTGNNPDGFIGSFSISGSGYKFANGSTTLWTGTTDWRASPAGSTPYSTIPAWTGATGTPQSYGLNGVGPWGTRPSIASGAEWIWSNSDNGNYAEFSTTIFDPIAVPEASTWGMLLIGFAALGFTAIRQSRKGPPATIVG
jgi:hypothetical protein